jgi:hypothetical protein
MAGTRSGRLDENHTSILRTLQCVPYCSAQSIASLRNGAPDILVGFRQKNFLLEVKTEQTDLNEREAEWHRNWRGRVSVVRSSLEALLAIGLTYREAGKIFKKLRQQDDGRQPVLPGAENVRDTENTAPMLSDALTTTD